MKRTFLFTCVAVMLVQQWTCAQIHTGENILIDEVVDHDLYIAGGTVTISAPIKGDLIVAGGTIFVNDTVAQDILMTGGNIFVNGPVGDDLRCAGGTVKLNGTVMGDLIVAGSEINIGKDAVVTGNVFSSGGEIILDGYIKGNLKNASGTFTLNGLVEGEMFSKGGNININGRAHGKSILAAENISLGPGAKFDEDVVYWNSAGSLEFKNSLNGGKAVYDPGLAIETGKWHYLGFASFVIVLLYLATALLMILLIQYMFSTTLKNAAATVKDVSLKSLGLGILFLTGVPVAVTLLFLTIVGIPIGILVLISYVTIILLATVIVALIISNWINNVYYRSSWANGRITSVAFGIFVVLKLASLTPFIGPLIILLLACMAFGSILLNVKWKRSKVNPINKAAYYV